jgi:hypothetical protein
MLKLCCAPVFTSTAPDGVIVPPIPAEAVIIYPSSGVMVIVIVCVSVKTPSEAVKVNT